MVKGLRGKKRQRKINEIIITTQMKNAVAADMDVKAENLKGKLEGFNVDIVKKMLEYQSKQGNIPSLEVFEKNLGATKGQGGFNWSDTDEGFDFWNEILKVRRKKEAQIVKAATEKKYCPRCGRILPIDNFNKSTTTKDGLWVYCKECTSEMTKKKVEAIKTFGRGNYRTCAICHTPKPLSEFSEEQLGKRTHCICKECEKDRYKDENVKKVDNAIEAYKEKQEENEIKVLGKTPLNEYEFGELIEEIKVRISDKALLLDLFETQELISELTKRGLVGTLTRCETFNVGEELC